MKQFDETLSMVLKNFSTINSGIVFTANSTKLKTISPKKTIFATFPIINYEIDRTFGIYNIQEFLSVLTMFRDYEIECKEQYLLVKDMNRTMRTVKYFYASNGMIVTPPDKDITVGDTILEFKLDSDTIQDINRSAKILRLNTLEISTNKISLFNDTENSSNDFNIDITPVVSTTQINPFRIDFESFKVLKGDYTIQISNIGLCKLECTSPDFLGLSYYLPQKVRSNI
jgi:hypothetical protein